MPELIPVVEVIGHRSTGARAPFAPGPVQMGLGGVQAGGTVRDTNRWQGPNLVSHLGSLDRLRAGQSC